MISLDPDFNKCVHKLVIENIEGSSLNKDQQMVAREIAKTCILDNFPGALLPQVSENGSTTIVVAFEEFSDWYKLSPIIRSFCGPSFSDFEFKYERDNAANFLPSELVDRNPNLHVTKFQLSTETRNNLSLIGLHSLRRAINNVGATPNLYSEVPVPTSFLLRNYEDALLAKDRDRSWSILNTLRGELRLDSMNLKFLEVQLHATFSEWNSILNMASFRELCRARKSPLILNFLLRALNEVYLDKNLSLTEQVGVYVSEIRQFTKDIFTKANIENLNERNVALLVLEALAAPKDFRYYQELLALIDQKDPLYRYISEEYAKEVKPSKEEIHQTINVLVKKLRNYKEIDSLSLFNSIRDCFDSLSKEEFDALSSHHALQSGLAQENQKSSFSANNWLDWFARLNDASYDNFLDQARMGANEWEIPSAAERGRYAELMYSTINDALSETLTAHRLTDSMPYLVKWLSEDPEYPSFHFKEIYAGLIAVLTLSEEIRTKQTYGSVQILTVAMLSFNLNTSSYEYLLQDLNDLIGDGIGLNQVYWVLDLIEELYTHPAPSNDARTNFLHSVGSKIQAVYPRLNRAQLLSVNLLFSELQLHIPKVLDVSEKLDEGHWSKLNDKKIAIYTLTTSAGRRATQLIKNLSPSAQVVVNSQQGGSDQLKALAENSDYFIISWLSAKHAATDFIRDHRPAEKIVYAQGKGASSIIRSLESVLTV